MGLALLLSDKRNIVITVLIFTLAFVYFNSYEFNKYEKEALEKNENEEGRLKMKKLNNHKNRKLRSKNAACRFRQTADYNSNQQSWKRKHVVASSHRVRYWLLLWFSLQRADNVQKRLHRRARASNKRQDGCCQKPFEFKLGKRGWNCHGHPQSV